MKAKQALFIFLILLVNHAGAQKQNYKWVIEPQFDIGRTFSEGMASTCTNGLWTYIDKTGKKLFSRNSQICFEFHSGRALVKENNRFGYIDKSGKVVLDINYKDAYDFDKGMAPAIFGDTNNNPYWGWIDTLGHVVIQARYQNVSTFFNDTAYVCLNGLWGMIDRGGKYLVEPSFPNRPPGFYRSLMLIHENNKFGFRNAYTNEILIPAQYDNADDFKNGYAKVCLNNKWGLIDMMGKVVVEIKYDFAEPFSDGLAQVTANNKKGFVNKKGEIVISPRFEDTHPYTEGLIGVKMNGKWGYIEVDL
jgi:hypothetical protein